MRILFAIPHFFHPTENSKYGSQGKDPQPRIQALTACITSLHQLFGKSQSSIDIAQRSTTAANQWQSHNIDIIICTSKDLHILGELPLPSNLYKHYRTQAEPLLLGFECQALLRDCLGSYDYFCYLEDDLILHDPLFFVKLDWFNQQTGNGYLNVNLLQPNRFEVGLNLPMQKAYIDGDLSPRLTAKFQNVQEEPELKGQIMNNPVLFRRALNPHSGCYFLNVQQMNHWEKQPYFLDRDTSFVGPLESAATVGIMRTFRIYKAAPQNANFLEIQHFGSAWIQKFSVMFGLQKDQPVEIEKVTRSAINPVSSASSYSQVAKPVQVSPVANSENLPHYYNSFHPALLTLLPADAKIIVELGCGAGALGEKYKQTNPHCQYIGLELNQTLAQVAASRLDRVFMGNIEDPNFSIDIAEGTVDCLVFGDVLEHLIDPWATLKNMIKWLKEDGQVLACIPNVQHWSLIAKILRGNWQYEDQGLLDRTHLRFFTLDTIKEMFAQTGLQIYEIQTRGKTGEDFQKFQQILAPVVKDLGLEPNQFAAQTGTFQYLVRAIKSNQASRRLLIQTMMMAPLACDRVRVLEPDQLSATIPGVRTVSTVKTADLSIAQPGEEKVFIWQRGHLQKSNDLPKLQELLRRGYLIVAEIDDDPMRWPAHVENDFFTYRTFHCVQTSTEPLAAFLRGINPNVKVFPNQLAYLPPPRQYQSNSPITIFFGALNREEDWAPIMPVINRVLADNPNKLQVQVIYDQKFFDALQTPHKKLEPLCAYERYLEILHSCDIGLLPLNPTRFNSMKSDLKYLECAGHGVAVLASPTVYAASIQEGETGLIYRSVEEFESKLRQLIVDVNYRQKLATNAYNWVKNNRLLSQHYRQRRDWYLQMLDQLPRLNAELKNRVPELFT